MDPLRLVYPSSYSGRRGGSSQQAGPSNGSQRAGSSQQGASAPRLSKVQSGDIFEQAKSAAKAGSSSANSSQQAGATQPDAPFLRLSDAAIADIVAQVNSSRPPSSAVSPYDAAGGQRGDFASLSGGMTSASQPTRSSMKFPRKEARPTSKRETTGSISLPRAEMEKREADQAWQRANNPNYGYKFL